MNSCLLNSSCSFVLMSYCTRTIKAGRSMLVMMPSIISDNNESASRKPSSFDSELALLDLKHKTHILPPAFQIDCSKSVCIS